ncbi:sigma-70 family RNA polymerase sigma factor [Actinophytocola glycyrrhizae]|uniref:Sigma-70 family RNA polymerase sigma factor n=1 Tax=Actinophytocola glycyrrhizae TaxID=2044873 RepID=A0ABV9S6U3_9PSEU
MSERTDTELVAGVLAGDRDAFAAVYDRYADRLHDFCWSVLRDRDEAADAVQDTFVLAVERLAQLNDPERLRPWLYAIARSVALRRVRVRGRVVLDEVEDMADTDPGPQRAAEQQALTDLVWSAAAGLSERDRALLDLHLRQGLDGAELGEAVGVSANHAYVLLTRLRDQVERSLGALLIARLGRKDCTGLDALLSGWDGRFSPLLRKRVARHVDACEVCSERRRVAVSPLALLAGVPLLPAPLFLKDRVMAEARLVSADRTVITPMAPPPPPPRSRRGRVVAAGVAALALLAAGSAVVYWRSGEPLENEPLALENTVPTTTTTRGVTTTTVPATTTTTTPPTTTTTTGRATTTTTTRTTTTTTRATTTTTTVAQPPPPPPDTQSPVISSAAADQPWLTTPACEQGPTTSTVTVSAADNVGVTSVQLTWTGPGQGPGGGQTMSGSGGTFSATIGPFTSGGAINWSVTAADAAGNTSAPGTGTITVSDCPMIG